MKPVTGERAFPIDVDMQDGSGFWNEGMTLRDYFATNAPTDEVQELNFRHLSRQAQERITGMTYPVDPRGANPSIDFQIAEFEFKCAVNAAIRFKLADAMLKARQE